MYGRFCRQNVYIDPSVTGDEFRRLRERIGYTQAALAKDMDIAIRTLTRWETEAIPVPRIAELALRYLALRSKRPKVR